MGPCTSPTVTGNHLPELFVRHEKGNNDFYKINRPPVLFTSSAIPFINDITYIAPMMQETQSPLRPMRRITAAPCTFEADPKPFS